MKTDQMGSTIIPKSIAIKDEELAKIYDYPQVRVSVSQCNSDLTV